MFILFFPSQGFLNHSASCEKSGANQKPLTWEDAFYCTRKQLLIIMQNNSLITKFWNTVYFVVKWIFLSFFIQFYFLSYSFFSYNQGIFLKISLLVCLQLPKMQCVRNWCLHMNTYNLQHYIIFMPTFLNMHYTRSCCIAAVQELCVIFQYFPPYTGNV